LADASMTEEPEAVQSIQSPGLWWKRVGRRNIGYVAFVVLLIPFGIALEVSGPGGPDRGGGIMSALMLWGIGSLGFFVVNVVLLFLALARGQPAAKPLIACALPVGIVVGSLLLESVILM